ncbi:MAG TPA: hypothetical protein VGD74_02535, partial [Vulgatibacter sp.]
LIAELLPAIVSSAGRADYHVGVTTSGLIPVDNTCPGGVRGGENGRLFPVIGTTPRIITSSMPFADQDAAWRVNSQVGECHFDEQLFEAARLALSPPLVDHADDPTTPEANDGNLGFLRPDAWLSIVMFTEEAAQYPWTPPGATPWTQWDYLDFYRSLKPDAPWKVKVHGFTNPRSFGSATGDHFIDLIEATGGFWSPILAIHTYLRTAADWAPVFEDISANVFADQAVFALNGVPEDANGDGAIDEHDLEVDVDHVRVAPISPIGEIVWTYDPDANVVRFSEPFLPDLGSDVDVSYTVPCETEE